MVYPERKQRLLHNYLEAFSKYEQIIVVDLLNISTEQILKTRLALRKLGGTIIIGKNSIARLTVRILTGEAGPEYADLHKQYGNKPALKSLLPYLVDKIGFIFSDTSYVELKPVIENEKIKMPAKAGIVAPSSIVIPIGPTHQDPGKIGEFQRVGIQVKAIKGSLEVVKEHKLIDEGEIVSETVSAMCRLLNIIPFEYAMELKYVYLSGQIIPKSVIRITPENVIQKFQDNVKFLTAASLGAHLPNALSTPHMIQDTFKMLLSIGLTTDIKFKALEDALAAQQNAPAQVATGAPATQNAGPAKKEEEPVEEEEEDMDLGDMFG